MGADICNCWYCNSGGDEEELQRRADELDQPDELSLLEDDETFSAIANEIRAKREAAELNPDTGLPDQSNGDE